MSVSLKLNLNLNTQKTLWNKTKYLKNSIFLSEDLKYEAAENKITGLIVENKFEKTKNRLLIYLQQTRKGINSWPIQNNK